MKENPPRQNHLSFPTKQTCPTTYRRDDTPNPSHRPIRKLRKLSRGLLLRQNRLSFPTRAVLPDNGRHPTPTPISENSSANGCSRNYELFSFFSCFRKIFLGGGGHVPLRLCLHDVSDYFYSFLKIKCPINYQQYCSKFLLKCCNDTAQFTVFLFLCVVVGLTLCLIQFIQQIHVIAKNKQHISAYN